MAAQPLSRYQDLAQVRLALADAGRGSAVRSPLSSSPSPSDRRRTWILAGASLVAAITLVGLVTAVVLISDRINPGETVCWTGQVVPNDSRDLSLENCPPPYGLEGVRWVWPQVADAEVIGNLDFRSNGCTSLGVDIVCQGDGTPAEDLCPGGVLTTSLDSNDLTRDLVQTMPWEVGGERVGVRGSSENSNLSYVGVVRGDEIVASALCRGSMNPETVGAFPDRIVPRPLEEFPGTNG
ncbi:hypothetical protein GCM10027020_19340 [Nocardioides salsibiostraticola]